MDEFTGGEERTYTMDILLFAKELNPIICRNSYFLTLKTVQYFQKENLNLKMKLSSVLKFFLNV